MAKERQIHYKITADTKSAEQGINKLENQASQLGNQLKNVVIGYFSIRYAVDFLTKSLNAYMETEARNLRIQQTLINTRNYSIQLYKDLIKWSTEAQKEIGIEDDKIVDLMQTLIGFGTPIQLIKEMSRAVIDLATFLGTDLNSAAMLVGKTMEGVVNPLRRYGIEVKNAKNEYERAVIIINQLTERFGGITKTTLSGIKGDWEKIKLDITNIMEGIGEFISQGIYGVLDTMDILFKTATGRFNEWSIGYAKKWAEFSQYMAKQTKETLFSVVYQEAKSKAIKMTIPELEQVIKQYDAIIKSVEDELKQKETENKKTQLLLFKEEKSAYVSVLEDLKSRKKEHKTELDLIQEKVDKAKSIVEVSRLESELNIAQNENLESLVEKQIEYLRNSYETNKSLKVRLEILRGIKDLEQILSEITFKPEIPEFDFSELTSDYEKEVLKSNEDLMEILGKELQEIPERELSGFESIMIETFRNTFYQIENEWQKVWDRMFGEANSLIEIFLKSLSDAIINYATQFAAMSILKFLGIPILHSGGIIKKAHSGLLTRDEIPVIAKKGEMILTPQQQTNLFSLLKGENKIAPTQQNIYLIVDGETIVNKVIKNKLPSLINKLNYALR